MRGTKHSPLRRFLIAYAKGHRNVVRVKLLDGLGTYSHGAIRNMLWRLTSEGQLVRTRLGVYKLYEESN